MNETGIKTTMYVLYAPGHGFLYGNKLFTSREFSKARFFTKEHFARNSLKLQVKNSSQSRLNTITVDGDLSDIKIIPVTVMINPEDVFMTELGGDIND